MDWLHCNLCYTRHQNGRENCFYLSSCGHLYCNQCIGQARSTCKVCGKPCQTIKLDSPLKPKIGVYFSEDAGLIQQYIEDTSKELFSQLTRNILKEYSRIFLFQNGHRMRLLNHYMEKSNYLAENLDHVRKQISEKNEEIRKLMEHNANLKHQLEESSRVHQSRSFVRPGGCASTLAGGCPVQASCGQPTSAPSAAAPRAGVGGRLSVYTPPINGRIGRIPGSHSSNGSAQSLDQQLREVHQSTKTAGPSGQSNRLFGVSDAVLTPLNRMTNVIASEFVTPDNYHYKSRSSSSGSRPSSHKTRYPPIVLKRSSKSVLYGFKA